MASLIITNVSRVAGSNMSATWGEKFGKASAEGALAGYEEATRGAAISALSGLFVSGGGLATLYFGIESVISGTMRPQALVASMMLVWRVLGIARSAFVVMTQIDSLDSSARQLSKFMSLPQETGTAPFTAPAAVPEGDLRFVDVAFRYGPEGYPALSGINLVAKAGEITALSGRAGSGKTTLVKLALALYRPQIGRVMAGRLNVQQIEPTLMRRTFAYAPAIPVLLPGALREFIRGSSGMRDDDIEDLALRSGLKAILERYGLGLDAQAEDARYPLPQEAVRLASICRALAKRSQFVLLDCVAGDDLDPAMRGIARLLRDAADDGASVLVTSDGPIGWVEADAHAELDSGRITAFKKGMANR